VTRDPLSSDDSHVIVTLLAPLGGSDNLKNSLLSRMEQVTQELSTDIGNISRFGETTCFIKEM